MIYKLMLGGSAALAALSAAPASAVPGNGTVKALMMAGAPYDIDGPGTADSPSQRVDPNLPTSPYSGVVAIAVTYPDPQDPGGTGFVQCTGSLIDATHVLSAAHCVDLQGNGSTINLNQPGYGVTVLFNSSGAYNSGPGRVIPASGVVIHPDYQGFGVCPAGVDSVCVNDDLSIITLSQPAPADAQIYAISRDAQTPGTSFTMVGYGTTGDGWNGYDQSIFSYSEKRIGTNNWDLTDLDDEFGFAGGAAEVWYADFDGAFPSPDGPVDVDLFCDLYGVCSGDLGNQSESVSGPGDSGGPAFIRDANGKLYIAATSTFGGAWFEGWPEGTFGTVSGGVLLHSYLDWIYANSGAGEVPEPAMLGLFGLGALGLAVSRRRRKAAL